MTAKNSDLENEQEPFVVTQHERAHVVERLKLIRAARNARPADGGNEDRAPDKA